MQYEAMRRAQEMQQSANRQRSSQHGSRNTDTAQPSKAESSVKKSNQSKVSFGDHDHKNDKDKIISNSKSKPPSAASPIDMLFEDKEKLLILLLVLILSSEENSDPAILLALLYLII